jgi:hypothetical protein
MRQRLPRPLDLGLYVELPAITVGFVAWHVVQKGWRARWLGDFEIFRAAGHALVHGHSPYVQPTLHLLAANNRFVYPAPIALLFAPFNALGPTASSLVYLALSVVAVGVAVRLLGVTDWRCYGAALVGGGAYGSFVVGSIGPLLLLAVAAGWRYRDRAVGGVLLAVAAAAKLFLWPLLVWLLVTRRVRGAAAAAASLAAILGLWALLDLHGLREYPTTLQVLNRVHGGTSYSVETLAISAGASAGAAHLAVLLIALVGIAAIVVVRDDDRAALTVAVAVALFATPILWMHYLILLIVPVALARPVLATLWALPAALWLSSRPESNGALWRILIALLVIAGTTFFALRRPSARAAVAPAVT